MRNLIGVCAAGAFLVGFAGTALADDEGPNFTFGASASYGFNINDPDTNNPVSPNTTRTFSSMEQDESFNIDMVQVGVNGQRGRVGYAAKVDFGDLAAAAGDSADGDVALQEAYITYDADGVGAMAGRIPTPIGYEVLEPWGNAHISRSNGWQVQPINHDGLTVSASAGAADFMVGVVNGFTVADQIRNDVDDDKGVIASIGAGLSDELNLYASGIYTERRDTVETLLINAIASGQIDAGGAGIRYAVEGNWIESENQISPALTADTDLWNAALYLGTDVGATAIDLRWDYTEDEDSMLFSGGGANGTDVWSVTLTGSVPLTDGVDLRLEYRHDDADDRIYADDNTSDDGLDTVQAQVVWHPSN